MKSLFKKILFLRNLPKTLYVNFKAFPFKIAWKFPVFCGVHTSIRGLKKGSIRLETSNIKKVVVTLGLDAFKGTMLGGKKHKHSYISFAAGSKLVCKGKCGFASGNTIVLSKNAELIMGSDFSSNVLCNFFVYKKVEFGDDCFCGWNVSVRDGDGHFITNRESGEILNHPEEICVGNHVWLCSDVTVMKGVSISDNCVIACGSLVLRSCESPNSIYGGSPAKKIKENIVVIRDGHGYC